MPNTHPDCRYPSCLNTNPFLHCNGCHSVWYCSLAHARLDSSRHREECYATALEHEHLLCSLARDALYLFVSYIAFQRWYIKRYSWMAAVTSADQHPVESPTIPQSNEERWERTLGRMTIIWDLVKMGGALSLPLPIALLQLSAAFGSTVLRTMAILAFILAASSIVTASALVASKESLHSDAKRARWIDASICPKELSSIDFWTCLSWPAISFVWSILLSLLALTSLVVTTQPDPSSVGTERFGVVSAVITFLAVTLTCLTSFRVFKFLWMRY